MCISPCSSLAYVYPQLLVVKRHEHQLHFLHFTHQLNRNLISDRSQPVNLLMDLLEASGARTSGGHLVQPSHLTDENSETS